MDLSSANFVGNATSKAKNFWSNLGGNQRLVVITMGAMVFGLFLLFLMWLNKADYQILYTNLDGENASKIVGFLQSENISYKLTDEGKTITVPSDQVYDLRVRIAGEGNLVGSGIGFEIFDEVQMGQTEFVQRINYQRALQGELARTLSELPNIDNARVHLVVPQRSLFIEEQQSPSASVVLRLKNNSVKMSDREINGIVNLLVMSIEGLDRYHVSITDSAGNAIYEPEEEGFGANKTQLQYRMRFESLLERRINELLTPILGPGKAIAKVSADLDYSQRSYRKETYDPDGQVIRSEQKSEERQSGQADLEGGSPDGNFRGDGLSGSVSTQQGEREQTTTNYEINKIEESVIGQMGEVQKISIAVAIDGTYIQEENGEYTYIPRTQEELNRIRELVANAVGFNSARGDTIEVTNIPFGDNQIFGETNAAELLLDFANRMARPLLSTLLAFFFIMLVIRPIVMSVIRPRVESGEMLEGLEGLPAAEEQYALYEAQEEEARRIEHEKYIKQQQMNDASIYTIGPDLSIYDIKARALQLAERNMEQTISVVRVWMSDAKAKAA